MTDIRVPDSGFLTDGRRSTQAGLQAPLYWERDASDETGWRVFTLSGWKDSPRYLIRPCATSAFLRPTPLHAGEVAGSQPKQNGNPSRAKRRYEEIYSTQGGCIR